MKNFLIIWLGQIVSLFGSKLTEFALGVWVYQQTNSITQFSLILLSSYLPNILISPIAGIFVDRKNRRLSLVLSDAAAGISTLVVLLLVINNQLAIWHIYIAVAVISIFNAFQQPAYTAAISQLVPSKERSRANGMVQVSKAVAKIIAPVLGGVLVNVIGLKGVLSIDFATFLVAVASLLIVRLPSISRTEKPKYTSKKVFLWQEMVSGWRYIRNRPGLVKLLSFIAISYFTMGVLEVVFWPFILNFGSSEELGRVLSIGGCGMLVGSVMISVWGGPSRKIDAIVGCIMLQGLFVMLGGLRNSVIWAAVAIFGYLFAQPIIVSCNQAIWQSKVPQALQGRVFALQQMLERSLAIIAYLTSGPLVDQVLTPLMAEDNFISRLAQKLIRGEEPPQAIALILILVGTINLGAAMIAYGQPSLRRVEEEVPDAAENKLGLAQDFI